MNNQADFAFIVHPRDYRDIEIEYEYQEWWKYFLMPILIYPLTFWVAVKKLFNGGEKLKTNSFWIDGISPV